MLSQTAEFEILCAIAVLYVSYVSGFFRVYWHSARKDLVPGVNDLVCCISAHSLLIPRMSMVVTAVTPGWPFTLLPSLVAAPSHCTLHTANHHFDITQT